MTISLKARIAVCLAIATLAIYWQASDFAFLQYDDPLYTHADWDYASAHDANWIPLTWASHALDVHLFGMRSGPPHFENALLHALTSVLLFLLFARMTGATWPSAFVAIVFALHPAHVESVAWIAERKDVLCALFWMLALWAYLNYVERPAWHRYLLVAALFCAGLLSKPMMVTWPFAALLLDYWPLKRLSWRGVAEKLPLLALAIGASAVTFVVQSAGGAVSAAYAVPLGLRIQNAIVSYVIYLIQFAWPADLAVIYPYPQSIPAWEVLGAAGLLMGITALALRRPYFTVGWLWFVGTLVPVIQLVQIGLEPRANRYTYLPYIGLSIMAAWGIAERSWSKAAYMTAGVALAALTFYNLSFWRNTETLFQHAIDVTKDNWAAQLRLSEVLLEEGKADEAFPHIRETARLRPTLPEAHINLGAAFSKKGAFQSAETEYRAVLRMQPDNPDGLEGVGVAMTEEGRVNEAIPFLSSAVARRPQDADSHYNLGRAYGLAGRAADAIAEFRATVRLQPDNTAAHYNLGRALVEQDRIPEAAEEFGLAVRLNPSDINARFNLGTALANLGKYDAAIEQFQAVLLMKPDFEEARYALEACLKLKGK